MVLFGQLKKLITSAKRQTDEKDAAAADRMATNSGTTFFEGTSEITEEEKRKRVSELTPREHELLCLLLEGFTLKESAEQLSIKYSTANTHMTGIYRKLCVKPRAELIIKYRNT